MSSIEDSDVEAKFQVGVNPIRPRRTLIAEYKWSCTSHKTNVRVALFEVREIMSNCHARMAGGSVRIGVSHLGFVSIRKPSESDAPYVELPPVVAAVVYTT